MAEDTGESDTVAHDETGGRFCRRQRRAPVNLYDEFDFPDVFDDDMNSPEKGAKPLAQLAEEYLLEQLSETVTSTTNYSCGGLLPISQSVPMSAPASSEIPKTLVPFSIRWDVPGTDSSRKIQFPMVLEPSSESQIYGPCSPFNDILDAYKTLSLDTSPDSANLWLLKCAKLNRHQFSTDFDPNLSGIVDSIAQTLLPKFQSARLEGREDHQGAIAELEGLTIYKRLPESIDVDVDSTSGFCSLLVFLSFNNKGGTLRTRYEGNSTVFDWSGRKQFKYAVQWVAFQHGSRARIPSCQSRVVAFLKYTVRIVERTGLPLLHSPVSDLTQLPPFRKLKDLLDQPAFLADGGTLAYCCVYDYHHALDKTKLSIYHSLKGIDGIVFMTFRKLGLEVKARPMLYPGLPPPGQDLQESGTTTVGTDFHSSTPQVFNYREPDSRFYPPSPRQGIDNVQLRFQIHWPSERVGDLIWLTKQHNPYTSDLVCLSQVPMQRGMSAYPDTWWSNVVILVKIPTRGERLAGESSAVDTKMG